MRTYSFFYHYNKPLSRQRGKPQISIHYRGACMIVDNIVLNVKTWGRLNKRQPYFVVVGKAKDITIDKNVAYIS